MTRQLYYLESLSLEKLKSLATVLPPPPPFPAKAAALKKLEHHNSVHYPGQTFCNDLISFALTMQGFFFILTIVENSLLFLSLIQFEAHLYLRCSQNFSSAYFFITLFYPADTKC